MPNKRNRSEADYIKSLHKISKEKEISQQAAKELLKEDKYSFSTWSWIRLIISIFVIVAGAILIFGGLSAEWLFNISSGNAEKFKIIFVTGGGVITFLGIVQIILILIIERHRFNLINK